MSKFEKNATRAIAYFRNSMQVQVVRITTRIRAKINVVCEKIDFLIVK